MTNNKGESDPHTTQTGHIMTKQQKPKISIKKIQEDITDRVVASLKQGHTWKKCFNGLMGGLPKSGCNIIILAMRGYGSCDWGTYKAWQSKGGQVNKGEKGTKIVFSRPVFDKEDPTQILFFASRTFTVFNVEQVEIDGYEYGTEDASDYVDMTDCKLMSFFNAPNAPLLRVGSPSYAPVSDRINLPNTFIDEDLANGTIAHEIIHSTGHKSRLAREGVVKFDKWGSHQYSFEELIAELGSLFLCAELGLMTEDTQDNSAAYIESWLKVLKDNPSWIYKASQQASKATTMALTMVKQGHTFKKCFHGLE